MIGCWAQRFARHVLGWIGHGRVWLDSLAPFCDHRQAAAARDAFASVVLGTADMEHSGVLVGVEPAASVS